MKMKLSLLIVAALKATKAERTLYKRHDHFRIEVLNGIIKVYDDHIELNDLFMHNSDPKLVDTICDWISDNVGPLPLVDQDVFKNSGELL